MSKLSFAAALAASAMMGGFADADAATIVQTVSVPSSQNYNQNFFINAFDTSLGTLDSVTTDATAFHYAFTAEIFITGGEGSGTSEVSGEVLLFTPAGGHVGVASVVASASATDNDGHAIDTQSGVLGSLTETTDLDNFKTGSPMFSMGGNDPLSGITSCGTDVTCRSQNTYPYYGSFTVTYTYTPTAVPEPASALVLSGGLLGLFGLRRRRDPAGASRTSTV